MRAHPIRILLVEDEPAHAEAIRRSLLEMEQIVEVQVVGSLREYQEAIAIQAPDLAVLDLLLPDGRAESVLQFPPERGAFPQVVMTSHGDEQVAVRAMRQGALDYIVKSADAFAEMPHAIERALQSWQLLLESKKAQEELQDEATRRRILIEGSRDGIVVLDHQGKVFESNPRFAEMLGYSADEIRHLHVWDWDDGWPAERVRALICTIGPEGQHFETRHRRRDGSVFDVELSCSPAELKGQKLVFCVCRDITKRKLAEAEVQAANALLRNMERIAMVGAWEFDTVTGKGTWTDEVARIHDLDPSVTPDKDLGVAFYSDDSKARIRLAIEQAIAQGTSYDLELELVSAKGIRKWVHTIGEPVWEGGRVARLRGAIQDITQRRQTERFHALSAEILSLLNQESPGGTAIQSILEAIKRETGLDAVGLRLSGGKDAPGQSHLTSTDEFLAVDGGLAVWTRPGGLCRDAQGAVLPDCVCGLVLSGRTDLKNQLFTPGGSAWTNQAQASALRAPLSQTSESPPRQRCISECFQSVALIPIRVKQETIGLLQLTDRRENCFTLRSIQFFESLAASFGVALLRRKEEQLLRQLSRAVQQSPTSIVITDAQGNITYVNPHFTQVSGYTLDEVLGQNPRIFQSGEMSSESYQTLWATITQGSEWRGELQNRKKNGELHWESASISPVKDADGQITHFVAVKEDITEQKRLEMQFRQAQKLEAVGQLAGGVAHDFNNILAAIMMHLGLLQMKPELDDSTRLSLKELETEARRAATLTRQLLMFSRRSVLAVKPLDLNEVIADLLKMLNRLIGEQVNLRFDRASGLPLILADAGMMEQVLMNLVVNARDAMPKGGRITITTCFREAARPQFPTFPEGSNDRFVCLEVADTGTGIDAKTLPHIFEPFFSTKEAGKGTGLGLATVHGIVAQHQGWVEVESVVGQGTTFRVHFPKMAATTSEPAAKPRKEAAVRGGQETVLLVEDDDKVRRAAGQSLRVHGYAVHEACNGQEALGLWQTLGDHVDLLLTDMVMPEGITGMELAETLRARKPKLKVIISSGYSAEMVQAGVPDKAGIVYLPKPYTPKVLAEVVRDCLDS